MEPGTVSVRLPEDLWLFAAPRHRREKVAVWFDGTATIGHLVESLGVPLPEVGAVSADGEPVAPQQQPEAGMTLTVHPISRPQPLPSARFLLDVHFGALARRLRLLGIDAVYHNDATDTELIEQARGERRVLLTQDRGLLRRRALWAGAYVRGARTDEQLDDVLDRFAPPLAPWSRCTACNGMLSPVSKDDIVTELKPGTRRNYDTFAQCQSCQKIYWHGAHSRRLDTIVAAARRFSRP